MFHQDTLGLYQGSQVLDSNKKWNTEKYGPAGSDVSRQHVIQWFKYICIHSIRKKAIFY